MDDCEDESFYQGDLWRQHSQTLSQRPCVDESARETSQCFAHADKCVRESADNLLREKLCVRHVVLCTPRRAHGCRHCLDAKLTEIPIGF